MSLYSLAKALRIDGILKRNIYSYQLLRTLIGRLDIFLPLEPDFKAFAHFPSHGGIFLDVGANDGISARSFRLYNKTSPIVSIEANMVHLPALNRIKKKIQHFDFKMIGAGNIKGNYILYTPSYRRVPLTAYASLNITSAQEKIRQDMSFNTSSKTPKKIQFIESTVTVYPLDEFKFKTDFIKIDVEGYELPVLEGLKQTIKQYLPIFMIEHNKHNINKISDFFHEFDYKLLVYSAKKKAFSHYNNQFADNIFLIPSAKKHQIKILDVEL